MDFRILNKMRSPHMEQVVEEGANGSATIGREGSDTAEVSDSASWSTSEPREKEVDDECADFANVAGLTKAAIIRKRFQTEEGAYEFYKKLGKFHGFAIRKGDSGKDDEGNFQHKRRRLNL
ncbi:hypothetical protein PIB30_096571 [Stylosanthes scabra]|uniref:Uncharacterized protein n=1 Tax=Stylosanthes scabra TaxID=79078 RepID=A0ABU6VUG4_9FABA|nr:hypothetical protein [Stylosanthes scabra]